MPQAQTQNNSVVFGRRASDRKVPRRYSVQREKRRTSLEIAANERLRILAANVVDDDGKPATPEIDRWARGEGKPFSISIGYMIRAAKHGATREPWLAIIDFLRDLVNAVFDKYGRRDRRAA